MELTKHETKTLVLAIGVAIEKEKSALDRLKTETSEVGIRRAIVERSRAIADLDRIRKRLTSEH